MRRTERLKALDRALCPGKRAARETAAKRSLRLWPTVCVIDEAQNLFAHPDHGNAAGAGAQCIIKIGPAFGVILVIATQRPDKDSLPTGVSGNVSTRFFLKVMGLPHWPGRMCRRGDFRRWRACPLSCSAHGAPSVGAAHQPGQKLGRRP